VAQGFLVTGLRGAIFELDRCSGASVEFASWWLEPATAFVRDYARQGAAGAGDSSTWIGAGGAGSRSHARETVFLYADFQIPIDELRTEARRIVEASNLWDTRVFVLQVTDFKSDSVEIRILASAQTAKDLFDLRCEIREKILGFLQRRYPESFPRVRTTFSQAALPLPASITNPWHE
jgi:hypothetical protein